MTGTFPGVSSGFVERRRMKCCMMDDGVFPRDCLQQSWRIILKMFPFSLNYRKHGRQVWHSVAMTRHPRIQSYPTLLRCTSKYLKHDSDTALLPFSRRKLIKSSIHLPLVWIAKQTTSLGCLFHSIPFIYLETKQKEFQNLPGSVAMWKHGSRNRITSETNFHSQIESEWMGNSRTR